MAIADDLSALSEHILLIAFVINPVLISIARASTEIFSGMPSAFQRVRI